MSKDRVLVISEGGTEVNILKSDLRRYKSFGYKVKDEKPEPKPKAKSEEK